MVAFLPPLPVWPRIPSHSNAPSTRKVCVKRQPFRACVASQDSMHDDDSLSDFVSDTTHVVLDSRDIPDVLKRLQTSERDPDFFLDDFLQHAEHHADGTSPATSPDTSTSSESSKSESQVIDYFHPDFLPYLPRWAQDAFDADDTLSLSSTESLPHRRRLEDIAAQPAGIADCLLSDVAVDYSVPIEFIVDAVLALGADHSIAVDDSVKQSLNDKQIADLLRLLSTFDAVDLAERYSDRSVKEMVDDYDLHLDSVMRICEAEGFHMCSGPASRLSLIQEDRILDIMLKGAAMGDPYPSALEGLV